MQQQRRHTRIWVRRPDSFFPITDGHFSPCLVLSCLVLSCLVLSCLVLSCLVLSCLGLAWLGLSCSYNVPITDGHFPPCLVVIGTRQDKTREKMAIRYRNVIGTREKTTREKMAVIGTRQGGKWHKTHTHTHTPWKRRDT